MGAQVGQIKKSVNQGLENARRVYGGQSRQSPQPRQEQQQPSARQAIQRGATATNPQTGQRAIYDGQKWVPLGTYQETGRPQS